VHTPDETRSARRQGKPARRAAKTCLAVALGLLLAAGMCASSAGAAVKAVESVKAVKSVKAVAAVKPTVKDPKAVIAATAAASAIPTCDAGINNGVYEYYTDCTAGTYYARTVLQCQDDNLALGAEELGSSRTVSVSNCKNDDGLNTADNWGVLYCSSNDGDGTYEGYTDESGDISTFLSTIGGGNIPDGGDYVCEYDATNSTVIADSNPAG
jgi:hypothetical protein